MFNTFRVTSCHASRQIETRAAPLHARKPKSAPLHRYSLLLLYFVAHDWALERPVNIANNMLADAATDGYV